MSTLYFYLGTVLIIIAVTTLLTGPSQICVKFDASSKYQHKLTIYDILLVNVCFSNKSRGINKM
jgi:spore coat protein CotH